MSAFMVQLLELHDLLEDVLQDCLGVISLLSLQLLGHPQSLPSFAYVVLQILVLAFVREVGQPSLLRCEVLIQVEEVQGRRRGLAVRGRKHRREQWWQRGFKLRVNEGQRLVLDPKLLVQVDGLWNQVGVELEHGVVKHCGEVTGELVPLLKTDTQPLRKSLSVREEVVVADLGVLAVNLVELDLRGMQQPVKEDLLQFRILLLLQPTVLEDVAGPQHQHAALSLFLEFMYRSHGTVQRISDVARRKHRKAGLLHIQRAPVWIHKGQAVAVHCLLGKEQPLIGGSGGGLRLSCSPVDLPVEDAIGDANFLRMEVFVKHCPDHCVVVEGDPPFLKQLLKICACTLFTPFAQHQE
eukprot:RCo005979